MRSVVFSRLSLSSLLSEEFETKDAHVSKREERTCREKAFGRVVVAFVGRGENKRAPARERERTTRRARVVVVVVVVVVNSLRAARPRKRRRLAYFFFLEFATTEENDDVEKNEKKTRGRESANVIEQAGKQRTRERVMAIRDELSGYF